MKKWKIALLLVAVLVLLSGMLGFHLFKKMSPTHGDPIAHYPQPKKALLVIDIQEDFTGLKAIKPYKDGDKIIATTNFLLERARAEGLIVVYIKNVITDPFIALIAGKVNRPNAPGTEMDERLIKIEGSKTFSKEQSDAFSNPELENYLRENFVDTLYIVGLDAAYCVNNTIHGALNRGYKVKVFSEGIATESGKSLEALKNAWIKNTVEVKTQLSF